MRKRNSTNKWLFFGLVPVAAGLGWVAARMRRRKRRTSSPPMQPDQIHLYRTPISVPGMVEDPSYRADAWGGPPQPVDENKDQQVDATTKSDRSASESRAGDAQTGKAGFRRPAPILSNIDETAGAAPEGHALRRAAGERFFLLKLALPMALLAAVIALLSLYRPPLVQNPAIAAGGDAERGRAALKSWGCGSCHIIPGVAGATGRVRPNLAEVGLQSFIAGELVNTPENMVLWIMDPQEVSPGNPMPDTDVTGNMAWDMAAYLYSLSGGQIPGVGSEP